MSQCSVCAKTFTFNKNLYQHMRKKHNITPQLQGKISCPLQCEEKFRTYKELRTHLESFHTCTLEKEDHDFPDYETFETWKKRLEMTSGYAYIRRISEKMLRKGEAKSHYICHRSGVFRSESKGHRKLKKIGSNKIGTTCPSIMEVSRSLSDGKVKIVFWKTHFGHEADIQRTPISKKFRPRNSDAITFEVCAVLPAAGTGERMGLDTPKQYIPIHQKPLICYTVEAFLRISFIKKVVVVAAPEYLDFMLQTLSQMCALKDEKLMVTEGSGSRHQSIYSGLRAVQTCCETQPEIVIIHDGVRPFFSEDIVCNVVLAAKEHGAAGVTCPLISTVIAVDEEGFLDCSLDRNKFKASEMPQAFRYDFLCKAYAECSAYDLEHGTECLHLIQKYASVRAKLLPGTTNLWKVTHRKDIYTAASVVKENQAVGIISGAPIVEFLPFLKASLSKRFKTIQLPGKFTDSSLKKFPNLVKIYSNKNLYDLVDQLYILYGEHKPMEQSCIAHILFDSFDSNINFLELQRSAKAGAKALKPLNILVYFIVIEKEGSSETFEEVAELTTSLLFDSNPNTTGTIFFS
ncbi:D-ribitol-5-phosphate cytidylyltransferase-like isoform X2 [Stegodyphus dumicola]|nr:D-ribitol-5-phosphate cytidylyltransferase-like isoform X2 [Stegodyphus dumicola]XP_035214274.1 D-ribitol-5-phosphate cytidylyltransferase-like isoform X2 [Stegodyphus dumicola]XP_035214275.1 D-ribitol-5-phosphate cytidylyltransferase-like isoform X2 [Stegodyphus dumicola]XP_035214276.1 D-ribitol-5-phosphate cytidylyltransferase-like isoform X2 [Stegodyphus dumicola]